MEWMKLGTSEKTKIENEIHTKITLQNQRTKEPKIEAKRRQKVGEWSKRGKMKIKLEGEKVKMEVKRGEMEAKSG